MKPALSLNMLRLPYTRRTIGLLSVSALASRAFSGTRAATPIASPVAVDFDAILAQAVAAGIPGLAMAVSQAGEPVFVGAAGVSNLETQKPVEPDDRFRIYSIAKAFGATVVLQLVDEGVLALDDPVTKWLDTDAVMAIPNIDQVTIRQLLSHTSGVYDFADDTDSPFWNDAFLGPDVDWAKVWTIDELLAYASAENHAAYFAPGEGHHYSNTDYLLLGLIVAKATGNTYDDELSDRVIQPLGLQNTFLAEGADIPEGTISGYQMLGDQRVDVSISNLSWIWAAGGMVSTTEDLLTFADALFSGQLISDESFAEMFTFVPTDNPNKGEGMGIYRIETDNGTLTGMDGSGVGFVSSMMRHDDADITVVILANAAPDLGVDAARDQVIADMLATGS
jgi:CubicO group peptidase (beta-lactamase class C family)